MNKIAVVVSLSVWALGCASNPKSQAASPGSPDIAQVSSGDGSPDIAQTSSGSVPCSQEIALDCPGGMDGCLKNQTSVHVCVASNAQPGPSCSQDIALACGPGEVDACTLSPAPAAQHICVRQ